MASPLRHTLLNFLQHGHPRAGCSSVAALLYSCSATGTMLPAHGTRSLEENQPLPEPAETEAAIAADHREDLEAILADGDMLQSSSAPAALVSAGPGDSAHASTLFENSVPLILLLRQNWLVFALLCIIASALCLLVSIGCVLRRQMTQRTRRLNKAKAGRAARAGSAHTGRRRKDRPGNGTSSRRAWAARQRHQRVPTRDVEEGPFALGSLGIALDVPDAAESSEAPETQGRHPREKGGVHRSRRRGCHASTSISEGEDEHASDEDAAERMSDGSRTSASQPSAESEAQGREVVEDLPEVVLMDARRSRRRRGANLLRDVAVDVADGECRMLTSGSRYSRDRSNRSGTMPSLGGDAISLVMESSSSPQAARSDERSIPMGDEAATIVYADAADVRSTVETCVLAPSDASSSHPWRADEPTGPVVIAPDALAPGFDADFNRGTAAQPPQGQQRPRLIDTRDSTPPDRMTEAASSQVEWPEQDALDAGNNDDETVLFLSPDEPRAGAEASIRKKSSSDRGCDDANSAGLTRSRAKRRCHDAATRAARAEQDIDESVPCLRTPRNAGENDAIDAGLLITAGAVVDEDAVLLEAESAEQCTSDNQHAAPHASTSLCTSSGAAEVTLILEGHDGDAPSAQLVSYNTAEAAGGDTAHSATGQPAVVDTGDGDAAGSGPLTQLQPARRWAGDRGSTRQPSAVPEEAEAPDELTSVDAPAAAVISLDSPDSNMFRTAMTSPAYDGSRDGLQQKSRGSFSSISRKASSPPSLPGGSGERRGKAKHREAKAALDAVIYNSDDENTRLATTRGVRGKAMSDAGTSAASTNVFSMLGLKHERGGEAPFGIGEGDSDGDEGLSFVSLQSRNAPSHTGGASLIMSQLAASMSGIPAEERKCRQAACLSACLGLDDTEGIQAESLR